MSHIQVNCKLQHQPFISSASHTTPDVDNISHEICSKVRRSYLVEFRETLFDKVETRNVALLIVIISLQLVLGVVDMKKR